MKPMLATDWEEAKLRFPLIGQPKIDGVRGLNMHGGLTGRSLKLFKNQYTTHFYSQDFFKGFDGEFAAAEETHPDLCRLTTSALGTISGQPFTLWWLFDWVTPDTISMSYLERYKRLADEVPALQAASQFLPWAGHLRVVPMRMIYTLDELLEYDAENLDKGFEGTIIRDPHGKHKQGRSTVREGGLLRIKRFVESEAIVKLITEGLSNQNEAQINELGLQFRSSHQDNMIRNGLVGSMECEACETITDSGRVVISKGQIITVAPGNMPHSDREKFFKEQTLLLGKRIKFKFFPKGVKDKPRFPTFQSIRLPEDT